MKKFAKIEPNISEFNLRFHIKLRSRSKSISIWCGSFEGKGSEIIRDYTFFVPSRTLDCFSGFIKYPMSMGFGFKDYLLSFPKFVLDSFLLLSKTWFVEFSGEFYLFTHFEFFISSSGSEFSE